ncbi:uncharacterized protein LOC143466200 [Clavelina lepadiformis]|uniref:uncharacterized protein LOC143466200 n=1 Tax=Clavelina lepadiformis TaxID=159417 RepID=UPI004042D9C6
MFEPRKQEIKACYALWNFSQLLGDDEEDDVIHHRANGRGDHVQSLVAKERNHLKLQSHKARVEVVTFQDQGAVTLNAVRLIVSGVRGALTARAQRLAVLEPNPVREVLQPLQVVLGRAAQGRLLNHAIVMSSAVLSTVFGVNGEIGVIVRKHVASLAAPGIISRNRPVSIANSCGGEECSGDSSEEKTCNDICCPVDCAWSVWSEWSSCDRDCGGGKHTRNRSIDEISSCGGKTCEGPTEQSEACNEQCCPVDCEVTPWTPWSDCSAECGPNGTSTRDRDILVHSLCGGTPCPDELSEERPCNRFCYNGDVIPTGCSCGSGWRGDCCEEDIDECEEGLAGCHDDAVCVNIPGDFVCKCLPGYTGNGTHCANIDECKLGIHNCDVETTRCVDKKGSFDCDCLGGYIESKVLCHDMDECSTSLANCSEYATCLNVIGSYKCICDDGFKGDGRVCDDVDECLTPLDECKGNSVCRNTVGGYWCDCGEPYEYNDGECVDRSEGSTFDL